MDFLEPECAATSIGVANPLIIHLVTTLISSYCNTSSADMWPEDYAPAAISVGTDTYDFIVVGSGSAGAIVANRLSEDPNMKVLLIEAGGDPPIESEVPGLGNTLQGTEYDWDYRTRSNGSSCLAMGTGNCVWPKGKILGGTSSINGMLYARGTARDYDEWEKKGNPSWDWPTVRKYFRLSENFRGVDKLNAHGVGGPVNVEPFQAPKKDQNMILRAANELRYEKVDDFVDGNHIGFGYLFGTMQKGRRVSTAKAYLRTERENLHIIKNAVARRININENKTADSVTFVIDNQRELTMNASKEVIISAGTIESPKLLMLSGIGPRFLLNKLGIPIVRAAPVGDNLQDHTAVSLFLRIEDGSDWRDTKVLDGVYKQWVHQLGPLGVGVLNVGGFINSRKNADPYPDVQYIYLNVPNFQRFGMRYKPGIRQSIRHQLSAKDRLIAVYVTLLNSRSRGWVRLNSTNYKEHPTIFHNSLANKEDRETLIRGIKRQLEFEQTQVFKNHKAKFLKVDIPECNNHPFQSNEYWDCYVKYMTAPGHNQVGTVKMGPASDPTAIVDHHLRVHGIKGLRVVDASIMPTIVSGNTNAPTMMIGEKGSDFIKSSWNIKTQLRFKRQ